MENRTVRSEQIWLAVGSLMILATVALAVALIYTRDVMIPFVLAIFVTTVVAPMFDYQVTHMHFPRWLAVATTLLMVLAVLSLFGLALIATIQSMVSIASEYGDQVGALSEHCFELLNSRHIQIDEASVATNLEDRVPQYISQTASMLMALISHSFLVTIFVIFLLFGRDSYKRRTGISANIETTFRGYLVTMTIISGLTSVLVWFALWALGLQMAWLFGLLVFLLSYIPNVGAIVATLLPLPIAFTQFHNPWMIAAVVGIPAAIHAIIGSVVAPRLMADGLDLHPVTVLLALAFWGLLWGIVGLVLAVPIVAMLRIVLSEFVTTRPIAEVLSGRLPEGRRVPVATSV